MTLTVELTRSKITRNLSARVVQQEAGKKLVRGRNLLEHRRIRCIRTALGAVYARLGTGVGIICWDIQASPDLMPPYLKTARRRDVETELTS